MYKMTMDRQSKNMVGKKLKNTEKNMECFYVRGHLSFRKMDYNGIKMPCFLQNRKHVQ